MATNDKAKWEQERSLLPVGAITADLLDTIGGIMADEDEDHREPAWWGLMTRVTNEAMRMEPSKPDANLSNYAGVVVSALRMLEREGLSLSSVGGVVIKCIVLGWRMAECYLTQGSGRVQ